MSTVWDSGPPPLDRWPPRACAGVDTQVFFGGKDGGAVGSRLERYAKSFCVRCPARRPCLAYALPIVNLGGIWGGMNQNERARKRKAQQQKEA